MQKILITGALGQIGTELVTALRQKYGNKNVIASDLRNDPPEAFKNAGPYIVLDATNIVKMGELIQKYEIDTIYHLAGILSATGEQMPQKAWEINVGSLFGVLELGRKFDIERIFWPSSIASFGPTTPREMTPNDTILQPSTMYGVTKVTGELLVDYYWQKYQLDTRSMRLPGIISSEALPGGGTTDYAVDIYYKAIQDHKFTCFLKEDTTLPMMYMPDLNKSILQLMEADSYQLHHHVFNITGMSFTPAEQAESIRKYIPDFEIEYKPDFRQKIADTWPKTIDDRCAQLEWGWQPDFDLDTMTKDMIDKLTPRLTK